jgi:flavodoxin
MKTLIIYASVHHHNTEKVANVIAEILGADLLKAGQVEKDVLNSYERIGFGSGIYYGKFHRLIREFVQSLPMQNQKKAFTFSTSGQGINKYNESIELSLKQKGFITTGMFSCKGFDTWGPFKIIGGLAKGKPDAEDLENAKAFANQLGQ